MDKVLTGDVWAEFGRIANRSDRKIIAAIAYFYRDNGLRFRKGDLLICDASERAIANGSTSAKLLAALFKRGVELRNLNGLHAKLAAWGDYAVIGSSNLSQSSTMLTEAALLTNRPTIVLRLSAFILNIRNASDEINREFLNRIGRIKVQKRSRIRRKHSKIFGPRGERKWLASVVPLDENAYANERTEVIIGEKRALKYARERWNKEDEVRWLRWTGHSKFRRSTRPGDFVYQIEPFGHGARVLSASIIVHRQDASDGNWTRFYYVESRNSHPPIPFVEFKKLARRCGLNTISKNSTREIGEKIFDSIESLWPGD